MSLWRPRQCPIANMSATLGFSAHRAKKGPFAVGTVWNNYEMVGEISTLSKGLCFGSSPIVLEYICHKPMV